MLRTDLFGILAPFMKHIVEGKVRLRSSDILTELDYRSIYTPAQHQLETRRGGNCRHEQCAGCGVIQNTVFWADGGILERSLDDRLIYQDWLGYLYIDAELAEDLRLRELFPDLRYYKKYPVLKEPLDGEVLPGDPGWDGVFRPRATAPFAPGEFGDTP